MQSALVDHVHPGFDTNHAHVGACVVLKGVTNVMGITMVWTEVQTPFEIFRVTMIEMCSCWKTPDSSTNISKVFITPPVVIQSF